MLAIGGVLFFVASFLQWIVLDLGVSFQDTCAGLSDPDALESCQETFGAFADGASANAWDLILMSGVAVIMIVLAVAAVGVILRVIPAGQSARRGLIAVLIAVDVVMVSFVASFDISSVGSTLTADLFGDGGGLGPSLSGGLPSLGLGLGFWLAIAGLIAANVGGIVAQRMSRAGSRAGS